MLFWSRAPAAQLRALPAELGIVVGGTADRVFLFLSYWRNILFLGAAASADGGVHVVRAHGDGQPGGGTRGSAGRVFPLDFVVSLTLLEEIP